MSVEHQHEKAQRLKKCLSLKYHIPDLILDDFSFAKILSEA